MITTINEYKRFKINEELGDITTNVSSVDVMDQQQEKDKLESYKKLLQNYNSKKNNFKNIFLKDSSMWEKEAMRIYQIEVNKSDNKKYNNKYLVIQWEIAKLQNNLTNLTKQLETTKQNNSSSLGEEIQKQNSENIKKLQLDINNTKKVILDKQNELKQEIQEDLKEIQKIS